MTLKLLQHLKSWRKIITRSCYLRQSWQNYRRALRKHLVDKLSAGENLDSDQVRFLMDTKPQENLKTQKLNPADQRIIEEKIKKAKGPSATEMWEIYKKTSTGEKELNLKRLKGSTIRKILLNLFISSQL